MLNKTMVAVLVLVLVVPGGEAKLLESPEAVNYLHVELSKSGDVLLESKGPLAKADTLDIQLSIPQNYGRQRATLKEMKGADSYTFEKDEFGNSVVNLHWDRPTLDSRFEYELVFDVEVFDRTEEALGKDFPVTDMVSANEEMKMISYDLTAGLGEIEGMFRLSEYVYSLVDYQEVYQGYQKSARWVFENQKAVCDGFSNLLIGLLRARGYNAYYIAGYAYTETTPGSYWGSHGWVEAEIGGRTVTLDPTWLQSPVDSTHIRFTVSPDSNYSEYVWILSNSVRVNWNRNEPEVSLIEEKSGPRVDLDIQVIPEEASGESHILILGSAAGNISEECILSRLEARSCSAFGGGEFLGFVNRNQVLEFCGEQDVYWVAQTPKVESNNLYTCPVTITGAGMTRSEDVNARSSGRASDIDLVIPRVLTPGQPLQVKSYIENRNPFGKGLDVYLLFNGEVLKKVVELKAMEKSVIEWSLRAPLSPITYNLGVFSSDGGFARQEITVTKERAVSISNVSLVRNEDFSFDLSVELNALSDAEGEVKVQIGSYSAGKAYSLKSGEGVVLDFSYTVLLPGTIPVNVDVFSNEGIYEDGMVTVIQIEEERGPLEEVLHQIWGFFAWFFSLFGLG
jgi:hypothetical protein